MDVSRCVHVCIIGLTDTFSGVIPSSKTVLCSPDISWLADVHPGEPDGWMALPAYPGTPVQGQVPPILWWLFCLTKGF